MNDDRSKPSPDGPIDPEAGFPRLEGESEKEFIERFCAHLALLRRARDPGLDGKPPKIGEA